MKSFETISFIVLLGCHGFLVRVDGAAVGLSQTWREGNSEEIATTEGSIETTPDVTNITVPLSTNIYTINLAADLTDPSIYIKELPPPKYQPEINITTSITLHHIESISAQTSDFSVYLMFRHVWQDKRLDFEKENTWYLEDEYLSGSEWLYNLIWSPTLFFVNEKDSNVFQLSKRNVFVAISKNGTVTLTYRRVISCFTSVLRAITVRFTIKRDPGHYILDYYVPSIFLVVVSWVSFWLDPSAAPARVALGTSTMLTFITLSRNIGDELPKLSYLRAVEIWFFVCIAFIFLTLVEFAFANIISRRGTEAVPLRKMTSRNMLMYGLSPRATRFRPDLRKERTKSEGNLDVPRNDVSFNSVSFIY
ncbi:unnamed protein product [Darwinula stevensoni]|uniref:Uncharacterized protein n=1 Tax=Darwinula stevensoni TaxID=69355 RepID=A0A7R9A9D3_9CRUS|nr:unnamed protein product [Darwinula stevensoni]CAG0897099.1 unnamed protein product [Darwinula stevensoni]